MYNVQGPTKSQPIGTKEVGENRECRRWGDVRLIAHIRSYALKQMDDRLRLKYDIVDIG